VVIIGLLGLVWGAALTLATTWLGRDQPPRRAWAVVILLVLFVAIGLQAGSLPDDRTFGAVIFAVIVAVGMLLTLAATWRGRHQPSGRPGRALSCSSRSCSGRQ
jgi:peptidoglycan/LPS O-acetylase OafA/YrhL